MSDYGSEADMVEAIRELAAVNNEILISINGVKLALEEINNRLGELGKRGVVVHQKGPWVTQS